MNVLLAPLAVVNVLLTPLAVVNVLWAPLAVVNVSWAPLAVVNVVVGVVVDAVGNPVVNTVSFAALGAGSTALVWGSAGCPRVVGFGGGVSVASFRIEV